MTTQQPILDNHLHLDPVNGRGVEAAETFAAAGGTHLLVVNKPSWHYGVDVSDASDFRVAYEHTLSVTEAASSVVPGTAWPVLGVHPGLISTLLERGYNPDEATALMQTGLDVAAEYVRSGEALALKSGRPHYDVSTAVWEASNAVMRHAFSLGGALDCAVQLHTEQSEEMTAVAEWAESAGMAANRVVKHYAAGRLSGPTPSVIVDKDELKRAASAGAPFMMETDFIDDPDRPGAVMGPKTVPRRTAWMRDEGYDTALEIAHVKTPRAVYGIETRETLS